MDPPILEIVAEDASSWVFGDDVLWECESVCEEDLRLEGWGGCGEYKGCREWGAVDWEDCVEREVAWEREMARELAEEREAVKKAQVEADIAEERRYVEARKAMEAEARKAMEADGKMDDDELAWYIEIAKAQDCPAFDRLGRVRQKAAHEVALLGQEWVEAQARVGAGLRAYKGDVWG
jgi:hypothetical protein